MITQKSIFYDLATLELLVLFNMRSRSREDDETYGFQLQLPIPYDLHSYPVILSYPVSVHSCGKGLLLKALQCIFLTCVISS